MREFESIDTAPVAQTGEDPSVKAVREIDARDMVEVLMDAVAEREREILNLRFGLAGGPPLTLQQIGSRLNVTRARIGQIQSRAMAKMSAMLSEDEAPRARN